MSREVDLRKAVNTLLKGLQQQVFLIHKDEARNTRISLSTAQPIGPYWIRKFLRLAGQGNARLQTRMTF
jgi:hypothetical protein